jgi:lysozyme
MTANQAAFLAMLAHAEGTDRAADPYRCCYGFKYTIVSLADHPALTGEWLGESLASLGSAYAGKISDAAGRYQLIKPTWISCKMRLRLPDFGAEAQDAAALALIGQRGALSLIEAGDFAGAVARCAPIWASLPGSNAQGQPQREMTALIAAYTGAGGTLAEAA